MCVENDLGLVYFIILLFIHFLKLWDYKLQAKKTLLLPSFTSWLSVEGAAFVLLLS